MLMKSENIDFMLNRKRKKF